MSGGGRSVYASGECEIDLARRELRIVGSPVPVGGRAFEIVEILAGSAGELVTKDELMKRVWPNAIVNDNTLQMHISAVRKALGPYRAMLKTESGRGYRLLGTWTIRDQGSATPQQPRVIEQTPTTNIPAVTTGLIGRATATQRLRDLVSAYRVVTLTGPGGIGKTALALEVASELLGELEGAAWLVELASLSDPDLVPTAVASVLGLRLGGEISAAAVARAVGETNLLLILDNCEHLIDAAANFVEAFLGMCPRITVLVTSRETLRISGEYVYRVPPLEVPAVDDETPDQILGRSAVELFVARAAAQNSDFSLQAEVLPTIGSICRCLDGIPLAIEFAAARAATLGVQQVATGLSDRFALLTRGRRTALPRHQTLRAVLDWSHELLPEAERLLLCRLAVFPAAFTLDAAAAVVTDTELDVAAVTDGVANLVAKSLLMQDKSGTGNRWYLLETTRTYALEKLVEADFAAEVARRHADYCRRLFERAEAEERVLPRSEWLAHYGWQTDNLRAALDWAVSAHGDAATGVALTAAAIPLWMHLSLLTECYARTERALAMIGTTTDPRQEMKLHAASGLSLTYQRGRVDAVSAAYRRALEIAEGLDDGEYKLRLRWGLWWFHTVGGEYRVGLGHAQRFAALAAQRPDPNDRAIADRMIGVSLHYLGDQAGAHRHIERMLTNFTPPTGSAAATRFNFDQRIVARAMLGSILWMQGFPDEARRTVETAVEDARTTNAITMEGTLTFGACPVALWTSDQVAAERCVEILLNYASRYDLPLFRGLGRCLQLILLIKHNGAASTSALLADFTGALASADPGYHVMLLGGMAQALLCAGQATEGLATVERAVEQAVRTEEAWLLGELLRVQGELLLVQAREGAGPMAEDCFRQALASARRQDALSFELRAATSLAGLWRDQNRRAEAMALLEPVYDRFTEGFDTADLKAAKAVL